MNVVKILAIIGVAVIIGAFVLSIIAFTKVDGYSSYINKLNKKNKNEIENIKKNFLEKNFKELYGLSAAPRMGPPGEIGPQGEPGGDYAANGFITNNQINNVVDTFAGFGPTVYAYLNKKNFSTSQHWTLDNDGKITNKKTGFCLVGDGNTKNVYVDKCNIPKPSQTKYTWLKTGQFQFADDREKCLSITRYPYKNKVLQRLQLDTCKQNPTSDQQWFIGG